MNQGTIPIHSPQLGVTPNQVGGSLPGGNVVLPIVLFAKNVPVLTGGTNGAAGVDVATIAIPAGITRYRACFSTNALVGGWAIVTEYTTANNGSGGGGVYVLRDAPNGGGNAICGVVNPPTPPATLGRASASSATAFYTSPILYVNQNGDAGFSGVVSFYVVIYPLP